MDTTLRELLHGAGGDTVKEGGKTNLPIRFLDPAAAEIEFDAPHGPQRYKLKPLSDLYGQGHGVSSFDVMDDAFMPLMLCIEEAIVLEFQNDRKLTDGQVLLVVNQLAMNPEAPIAGSVVAQWLQMRLRLLLSLNDYSRQEVKMALRKVAKSVERHTRAEGPQGYLRFVTQFFGRRR